VKVLIFPILLIFFPIFPRFPYHILCKLDNLTWSVSVSKKDEKLTCLPVLYSFKSLDYRPLLSSDGKLRNSKRQMAFSDHKYPIHAFPIKFPIDVMSNSTEIYLRAVSDSCLFTRNFRAFPNVNNIITLYLIKSDWLEFYCCLVGYYPN